MQTFFIIILLIVTAFLILVAAALPRRSVLSSYELQRRKAAGNTSAGEELHREVLLEDIVALKRVMEAVTLVLVVVIGTMAFDLLFGVLFGTFIALSYGRISRIDQVHDIANRLYEQVEPRFLRFVEHNPNVGRMIRSVTDDTPPGVPSSREEIEHLVTSSVGILSEDEKKLIVTSLHFEDKKVEEVMTPRGVIESIKGSELIGPLVLSELHKTGHSRFPVTDLDIDHVVGVLHIQDLLTLHHKDSKKASQLMDNHVFYINQDQTLKHALAAFIKTRRHLFIVVNGYRETAGILTLEDVIEALIGRKIVDEFDRHDDLRVVAERSAGSNNNPPHATNV